MQLYNYLILHGFSGSLGLKLNCLGGQMGEGVVRYWPQRTRFYFWVKVKSSSANFGEIDQKMKPWECSQTNTQIDWQTQTDFIICPMLYAIAMGQNNNRNVDQKEHGLIWVINSSLSFRISRTLPRSLDTTRVEGNNAMLAGSPRTVTDRLKRVLNAAACIVSGTRKFDRGLTHLLHSELH